MIALRTLAFIVGAGLLVAAAHVTILHSGGYESPQAILTIGIAVAVGVGALTVGAAWAYGRKTLSGWLIVTLMAAEAFGILMTAERLIASREAAQAPLKDKRAARTDAEARVKAAEAKKDAADSAALSEAAKPGCRRECRTLIEGAKKDAQRELDTAREALAALPKAASATPLADRLGIAPWALDLTAAVLGSLAANGLAIGLIAFSAHGRREKPKAEPAPATATLQKSVIREAEHITQFAVEALAPDANGCTDLIEIHNTYRQWCAVKHVQPMSATQIGSALGKVFDGTGIVLTERRGQPVALGLTTKGKPKRKALGHMAKLA